MNESFTVEEIAELIRDEGYKALVAIDEEDGDATIESASDGTDWRVHMVGVAPFYESILIRASFHTDNNPIEDCNKFNNEYRFLKLYRVTEFEPDDGGFDVRAEMDCDFAGGVSTLMISATIRRWIALLPVAAEAVFTELARTLDSKNT